MRICWSGWARDSQVRFQNTRDGPHWPALQRQSHQIWIGQPVTLWAAKHHANSNWIYITSRCGWCAADHENTALCLANRKMMKKCILRRARQNRRCCDLWLKCLNYKRTEPHLALALKKKKFALWSDKLNSGFLFRTATFILGDESLAELILKKTFTFPLAFILLQRVHFRRNNFYKHVK